MLWLSDAEAFNKPIEKGEKQKHLAITIIVTVFTHKDHGVKAFVGTLPLFRCL